MSIVGVMNNGGPEGSGYVNGITNLPLIDSPEMCGGDRWFSVKEKLEEKERNEGKKRSGMMSTSSSESSIGKNSDDTGELKEDESDESGEIESTFKGPLDAMEALEDVLPMRRGISKFYNGKSKSFASLEEASSMSTIKQITKPENPYMKRRRNLLASSTYGNTSWDKKKKNKNKNKSSPLTCINGGGISKRVACNSSNHHRSSTALAFALSNSDNPNNINDDNNNNNEGLLLKTSSPSLSPFKKSSAWRSLSLADLQQPAGDIPATSCNDNPTQFDTNRQSN